MYVAVDDDASAWSWALAVAAAAAECEIGYVAGCDVGDVLPLGVGCCTSAPETADGYPCGSVYVSADVAFGPSALECLEDVDVPWSVRG